MIKSINAWVFSQNTPPAKMFELARHHGFEAVELTIAETGFLSVNSTEDQCREIATQANKAGIRLSSLASGLGWSYPITSTDSNIVNTGIEYTKRCLQIAKWLGVDAILLVPGGVGATFIPNFAGAPYDIAYENALASLEKIRPVAEDLQVTLAIENVWNMFLLSPLEFRNIIDRIGSSYVKAYFDVGNVVISGYPEQWIRILGNRIARVHFKDFKRSVGTIDGFCPLLEGDVDYAAVMKALQKTGYDGYVTAEFFDCETNLGDISAAMDKILKMNEE